MTSIHLQWHPSAKLDELLCRNRPENIKNSFSIRTTCKHDFGLGFGLACLEFSSIQLCFDGWFMSKAFIGCGWINKSPRFLIEIHLHRKLRGKWAIFLTFLSLSFFFSRTLRITNLILLSNDNKQFAVEANVGEIYDVLAVRVKWIECVTRNAGR